MHAAETRIWRMKLGFYTFVLAQLLLCATAYGQKDKWSHVSYLKWLYAAKFAPRAATEAQFDTLIVKQLIPAISAGLPQGFMKDFFKRDTAENLDSAYVRSFELLHDGALPHPRDIWNAAVTYTTMFLLFAEKGFYPANDGETVWLAENRTVSLKKFIDALGEMWFDTSSFAGFTEERVYIINDPAYSFQGHTKNGIVFINQSQLDFLKRQFWFAGDPYTTYANERFHMTSQLWYTEYDPKDTAEMPAVDAALVKGITYADVEEFGSVVTSMLVSENRSQELAEFLFLRIINKNFDGLSPDWHDAGYYGSTKLLIEILKDLGVWDKIHMLQKEYSSTSRGTLAEDYVLMKKVKEVTQWLDGNAIKESFLDMWNRVVKIY